MCFRRQIGVQSGDQVSDSCEEHFTHLEMAAEPAAHSKDGTLSPTISALKTQSKTEGQAPHQQDELESCPQSFHPVTTPASAIFYLPSELHLCLLLGVQEPCLNSH